MTSRRFLSRASRARASAAKIFSAHASMPSGSITRLWNSRNSSVFQKVSVVPSVAGQSSFKKRLPGLVFVTVWQSHATQVRKEANIHLDMQAVSSRISFQFYKKPFSHRKVKYASCAPQTEQKRQRKKPSLRANNGSSGATADVWRRGRPPPSSRWSPLGEDRYYPPNKCIDCERIQSNLTIKPRL